MRRLYARGIFVMTFLGLLLTQTGCETTGARGTGARASESMIESAQLIRDTQNDVRATLNTLDAMRTQRDGDISALYSEMVDSINQLERSANRVAATHRRMQKEGTKYFDKWNEQIASMANEDIRMRTEERRDTIRQNLDQVQQGYQELAAAYDEFIADVKDIQTALSADLTTGGVAAMSEPIRTTVRSGLDVIEISDRVADAHEELGTRMGASRPSNDEATTRPE